jgi:AmmeMemoRadiSam system protein B
MMNSMKPDVRPSPIAGKWYPGSAQALSQTITDYLQQSRPCPITGRIVGVIVPHAGYRYSGQVAAHAFRCLQGKTPDIVAVVSPYHAMHSAPILIADHEAYRTPLGEIPVDESAVQSVIDHLQSEYAYDVARPTMDQEHSLEIELPFLQHSLARPFTLLPIMLREQSQKAAQAIGQTLVGVLRDRQALLVASSDLSHFYPDEVARQLDAEILARAEAFDPQAVLAAEEDGVGFACGRGAIAAILWAAEGLGADQCQVVNYATSGDVTGDPHSVVGYAAAVLYSRE